MHIVEDFKIQCLWRDFLFVKQIITVLVLHTTTITLGYSLFKKGCQTDGMYLLRIHIRLNPLSGLSYFTPPFFACDQLTSTIIIITSVFYSNYTYYDYYYYY